MDATNVAIDLIVIKDGGVVDVNSRKSEAYVAIGLKVAYVAR
jgi:hypothetical protein